MSRYSRRTDPINLVDFSTQHDPDDYIHYSFAVIKNGVRQGRMFESIERSTLSVVYRGPMSYYERKDPEEYQYKMLKRRSDFKNIIRNHKIEDDDFVDDYVDVSAEDLLQKKMKEMLTKSTELTTE